MATSNTAVGRRCSDWSLNKKYYVMWFGEKKKMKVIGYSKRVNKVQVQHLDAQGSFYVTCQELIRLNFQP